MTDDHYLKPIWRAIIAVVASLIILFLGQPFDPKTAFSSLFFYLAFAVSFTVTVILMYIVHTVTLWLDRRTPWRTARVRRIALQLVFGFVIPTLLDFGLMAIYYVAIGRNIIKRGGHLDFVFAASFVLSLNLLYFGLHMLHLLIHRETELHVIHEQLEIMDEISSHTSQLLAHKEAELNLIQEQLEIINENNLLAQLDVKFEGGIIRFDVREEVLYFFRDKETRKVMAITATGRSYVLQDTLSALAISFAPVHFCQINPSVVINLAALEGYRRHGTRRATLQVTFRKEFQAVIGSSRDNKYRVTKDHIDNFRYNLQLKNTTSIP